MSKIIVILGSAHAVAYAHLFEEQGVQVIESNFVYDGKLAGKGQASLLVVDEYSSIPPFPNEIGIKLHREPEPVQSTHRLSKRHQSHPTSPRESHRSRRR